MEKRVYIKQKTKYFCNIFEKNITNKSKKTTKHAKTLMCRKKTYDYACNNIDTKM